MDKQLLIEMALFTPTRSSLNESMGGSNRMIVEGLIQKAETKNGNGRIYPYEVLKREADKYLQGPVRERRALGELDHPDSQVINLRNASHAIREVWWRGDEIWGKVEIFADAGDLGTSSGRIAGALVRNGLLIGISSRGMGSLKQVGEIMEVQDDFELVCFDLVSEPSTTGAFMLKEGMKPNLFTKADRINRILNSIIK